MKNKRPVILITMGDPSGIGPEIIIKAFKKHDIHQICSPLVIGDFQVMQETSKLMNLDAKILKTDIGSKSIPDRDTIPVFSPSPDFKDFTFGKPSKNTGKAVFSYIKKAIELCMEKKANAIATAPINKLTFKESDIHFNGHTEILAHFSNTKNYAMMMYGREISTVLVTIHIPLKKVPGELSVEKIYKTIELTNSSLKERFGIQKPALGICGLNPHSGESGLFGDEEEKLISPAIEKAREKGINITGPVPPDTAFVHARNKIFDCVISLYHDQGLIPFKLIHFKDGVNTTLGLPFPRTSVDHGTAYDIAGKNMADEESLVEAIKLAVFQANNMKKV